MNHIFCSSSFIQRKSILWHFACQYQLSSKRHETTRTSSLYATSCDNCGVELSCCIDDDAIWSDCDLCLRGLRSSVDPSASGARILGLGECIKTFKCFWGPKAPSVCWAWIMASVWRPKCFWGPSAFCIYRLKWFAENFVTHTHTDRRTSGIRVLNTPLDV